MNPDIIRNTMKNWILPTFMKMSDISLSLPWTLILVIFGRNTEEIAVENWIKINSNWIATANIAT